MVRIRILKKDKTPFSSYLHQEDVYIEGIDGEEYFIEMENISNKKIEVVGSIDGRDIVSGKSADYKVNRGYILNPYETQLIKGYRIDNKTVGQFKFCDKKESFASNICGDGTENVGVFGFAVFEELNYHPTIRWEYIPQPYIPTLEKLEWSDLYYRWYYRWDDHQIICSTSSDQNNSNKLTLSTEKSSLSTNTTNNLGTSVGQSASQEIKYTTFIRSTEHPKNIIIYYYDNEDGLIAQGIKQEKNKIKKMPNPFPDVIESKQEETLSLKEEEKFEIII